LASAAFLNRDVLPRMSALLLAIVIGGAAVEVEEPIICSQSVEIIGLLRFFPMASARSQ
jgi:hypothetical protein